MKSHNSCGLSKQKRHGGFRDKDLNRSDVSHAPFYSWYHGSTTILTPHAFVLRTSLDVSASFMDQSPLLSLPTELLEQLAPHLSTTDLANLRCASIHLAHTFRPFLVDVLELHVSDTIERRSSKFPWPSLIEYVPTPKTLLPFIQMLSIALDFEEAEDQYLSSLRDIAKEEIAGMAALKHFKLKWPDRFEGSSTKAETIAEMRVVEEEMLLAVLDATHGRLEHFELLRPTGSPSPRLSSSFMSLRKLSLGLGPIKGSGAYIAALREALAQTSTLESLNLEVDTPSRDPLIIQDLFPTRSMASHLPLRRLRIRGRLEYQRNFPITDMPQLPSLQTLSVTRHGEMEGFWDLLRMTKHSLQDLELDHPFDSALVQCLTSFQGLQRLWIKDESLKHSIPGGFPRILHSHASTLTLFFTFAPACLGVQYDEGNNSSFDALWPSPALFANLQYLFIQSPDNWVLNTERSQKMLDWLEKFPALEHACILWSANLQAGDVEPSSTDIGRKLVGRTGRPKYWTNSKLNGINAFIWEARSISQNTWSYTVIPDGDHLRWRYWGPFD